MRRHALPAALALGVLTTSGIAFASDGGSVLSSSDAIPLLQYPEGITAFGNRIYVATLNYVDTTQNRIFVFDDNGALVHTIGDKPGQELVANGAINGLIIQKNTGDLYAASNATGNILRIQNPNSDNPTISIFSTYPAGGGPEDMSFHSTGTLFASDSNLGVLYEIPPGGGPPKLVVGPPSTGAPIDDKGLFASPVVGLSPNGLTLSRDGRTLFVANTFADSVVALDVNDAGHITGNPRIFAQNFNPDLEEYPTGFDALVLPNTKIGPSASTPLNGPDGLAMDSDGHVWVASNLGDNLTELSGDGHILRVVGKSSVTSDGLLNQPASISFHDGRIYATDLSIFTGFAGTPIPFRVVSYNVGEDGFQSNGND
jgi:sugar lactone lactonase YvrE